MKRIAEIAVTLSTTAVLVGCVAQTHSARGWGYLAKKDPDRAIEEFQRGRELPGALVGLSNAYLQKGDRAKSEAYLDEALHRYPNDWATLFTKGNYCLTVTKDYGTAIQYLERCKQLKPGLSADIDPLIQKAKQEM